MKLLILTAIASVVFSQQLVPVPNPPDGFFLSPTNSTYNFTLEAYLDHLCDDCKAAYPGLISYYQKNSGWLQLIIHMFPVPYHTYAFFVTQAGRYIQEQMPSKFLNFMSYMFDHQEIFLQQAYSWDIPTLLNKIAQYTATATGANFSDVLNALKDADLNERVRVSWKYACDRIITGTPQFLVNGVLVAEATTYTKEASWEKLFDSLKPN